MLDEVAEMPLDVQAAFLRVLETGRFRRVGGRQELEAQVRIVAATNKDLRLEASQGRFREDLLYRLNAVELRIPPLRDRREDIGPLAAFFCRRMARAHHLDLDLSAGALAALRAYSWPGNVRELRNVVERTAVVRGCGSIDAEDLRLERYPNMTHGPTSTHAEVSNKAPWGGAGIPFPTLETIERHHIHEALRRTEGNRSRAASLLGIARSTLLRKLERYPELDP